MPKPVFTALSVAALVAIATPAAQAAQFVLVDHTYIHVTETHHYGAKITVQTPTSWSSPIDYTDATFHFRLEIKKKPNDTIRIAYQSCLIGQNGYTCSNPYGPRHQKPGVYEWSEELTRFYRNGNYDRGAKPREIHLIVKDKDLKFPEVPKNGGAPDYEGAPNLALYYPMEVRFTVWVVKKGDTFQRDLPGEPGPVDPGRDAGARDGGAVDALATPRPDASPLGPAERLDAADRLDPTDRRDATAAGLVDAPPGPRSAFDAATTAAGDTQPAAKRDAARAVDDDDDGLRSGGCSVGAAGVARRGAGSLGAAALGCWLAASLLARPRRRRLRPTTKAQRGGFAPPR